MKIQSKPQKNLRKKCSKIWGKNVQKCSTTLKNLSAACNLTCAVFKILRLFGGVVQHSVDHTDQFDLFVLFWAIADAQCLRRPIKSRQVRVCAYMR